MALSIAIEAWLLYIGRQASSTEIPEKSACLYVIGLDIFIVSYVLLYIQSTPLYLDTLVPVDFFGNKQRNYVVQINERNTAQS